MMRSFPMRSKLLITTAAATCLALGMGIAAAQGPGGPSPRPGPGAGPGPSTETAAGGAAGANVTLNTEQKTKIRETVINASNAPRVTNVNFAVNVGTVVPSTVRFAPVPSMLVEINPSWRSYEYFIVS